MASMLSCVFGPRRSRRRLLMMSLSVIMACMMYITLQPLWASSSSSFSPYSLDSRKLHNHLPSSILHSVSHGNDTNEEQGLACKVPKLELWHPELTPLFNNPITLHCEDAKPNWVYVSNGTFQVSPDVLAKHGKVWCEYTPVDWKTDLAVRLGKPVKPMTSGTKLSSDFFESRCVSADGAVYKNIHSGIHFNEAAHSRAQKNRANLPKESMKMNIFMLGLDSVSRMTWMRTLPKSHEFFTKTLGGIVLEGYNIVGDGTPQALLPILAGKTEIELPEARRGFSGAQHVDTHPWIWRDLHDTGYVSQWGEDGAAYGTFSYRMKGFKQKPVDHYMRPFYLRAEQIHYGHNYKYCLGSVPRHKNMLNWIDQFIDMYPDQLKFSFLFHSELSHDSIPNVRLLDNDLLEFLETLNKKGFLDNTIFFLMADHGPRFSTFRQTEQGKYEERMPYMSVRVPPSFRDSYPEAYRNLQNNVHKLTSPFDIHETFHDILKFFSDRTSNVSQRGISLFKKISAERTCKDIGIEAHWCTCLDWVKTPLDDYKVIAAAGALIKVINDLTGSQRDQCEVLTLQTIRTAVKFSSNSDLLKFKKSKDTDGRNPDMSDNMMAAEETFQLSLTTSPGDAMFEATVKYSVKDQSYLVNNKDISRINKYGNQPHCIMNKLPHLRSYCYCKVQRS